MNINGLTNEEDHDVESTRWWCARQLKLGTFAAAILQVGFAGYG